MWVSFINYSSLWRRHNQTLVHSSGNLEHISKIKITFINILRIKLKLLEDLFCLLYRRYHKVLNYKYFEKLYFYIFAERERNSYCFDKLKVILPGALRFPALLYIFIFLLSYEYKRIYMRSTIEYWFFFHSTYFSPIMSFTYLSSYSLAEYKYQDINTFQYFY